MQISSTLQNTIVPQATNEPLKNSAETTKQMPVTLTSSINKNAFDYVDLGEDISAYTTVDPKQEQTNQELISYLSNLMSDQTDEGRKNLASFNLNQYSSLGIHLEAGSKLEALHSMTLSSYQLDHPYTVLGTKGEVIENMSFQELYDFLGKDAFGKNKSMNEYKAIADRMGIFHVKFDERQEQFRHELSGTPTKTLEQGIKDGDPNLKVLYFYDARQISKEEADAIEIKHFKNLYSLSDSFAKTDTFQELYLTYQTKNKERSLQLLNQGKNPQDVHTLGAESFITAKVVSDNLSKSEVIEHYTTITQNLKDLRTPPENTTYSDTVTQNLDDSIKLYEKITSDLKQMWHYGDVDMQG